MVPEKEDVQALKKESAKQTYFVKQCFVEEEISR
jgi:hypothetical protein